MGKGRHTRGTSRRTQGIVAAAALAAVVAGCGIVAIAGGGGTDGADAATTTPTTPTTAATTTVTEPPPPPPTWPLTGMPVADPAALARPALAVKIDNAPEARPQVGINQADVVYEEKVEGGITRFMAVFHSQDAQPIGPVRSGRSTDIAIFSALNRPMFAWSGSNGFMAADIQASNMVDVGHTPAVDQYYRDGSRRAPHNLFIAGYLPMVDSHRADAGVPPSLFSFRPAGVAPIGDPVAHVALEFGSVSVAFDWNGQGWARTQNGRPHVDAAGVQAAPVNVVVQFVEYQEYIHGGNLPVGQLVGEGDVWVLTGGVRVIGRWVKPSPEAVTQYLLPDGSPIGLTPGQTFVELVPPGGATVA
jgi:hypothetical protein